MFNSLVSLMYGYEEFLFYEKEEYKEAYLFLENLLHSDIYNEQFPFYWFIRSWQLQLNNSRDIRFIQINITNACNLKCIHCCRHDVLSKKSRYMSLEEIKLVLDKFEIIQSKMNLYNDIKWIHISGGECTLHPEFFDIMEYVISKFEKIKILTNLTFLNDDLLSFYKKYKEKLIIQVSIDGVEETHDKIRGRGMFQKSFNNIKTLLEHDINVTIKFTSNNLNYKEFDSVYELMSSLGIDDISCQRYIDQHNNFLRPLNYEETMVYYKQLLNKPFKNPPMFIDTCNSIYNCDIGKAFLVHENGDMPICRHIPILYANAITDSVDDIISGMKVGRLKSSIIPKECMKCKKSIHCLGGTKCLSYAEFETFDKKDILCNIKNKIDKQLI